MKHLFLASTLLFTTAIPAMCDEIPLTQNGVEDGVKHPPHKAPHPQESIPNASYNADLNIITFTCHFDLGCVAVSIANEDGTTVLSELVYVEDGTVSVLSVAQLPVGNYTLYIEIDGSTYSGEFTI